MKKWKKGVAAAMAALTLAATPAVSEAYIIDSAWERRIGADAVRDFEKKHSTYESDTLTYIQDRLIEFNPDKLWMQGAGQRSKRYLQPIRAVSSDSVNAYSFPGGWTFVLRGQMDTLALKENSGLTEGPKNEWKSSNIYQYASLAAVVGHELTHWANEDFVRKMEQRYRTALGLAFIPVANIYTALGLSAGGALLNAFNSRAMGFRTEQEADEGSMRLCENVPEFSIGGEAIQQYRMMNRETQYTYSNGLSNWLNPHSKTAVRLKRALEYITVSSKGFIVWKDFDTITVNGDKGYFLDGRDDVPWRDRTFYVMGQIATAIKYDIAKPDNLLVQTGSETYNGESPNITFLLVEGRDKDGQKRMKVVDKFLAPKEKLLKAAKVREEKGYEEGKRYSQSLGISDREVEDFVYVKGIFKTYFENRIHYLMNETRMSALSEEDEMDDE